MTLPNTKKSGYVRHSFKRKCFFVKKWTLTRLFNKDYKWKMEETSYFCTTFMKCEYMEQFEIQLQNDLHQFLLGMHEVDERLPECPDVEEKWEEMAKAYIPDGIREFNDFPSASLGWMMYIGMAVAKFWDLEWEIYSNIEDLYAFMRDKRGYDSMDEYIREEVLLLKGVDYTVLEKLVGECASRVYNALRHQNIEPGTKDAFNAYVACLHQLYLFGAAMQLKRMGYRMTKMN